MPGQLRAALTLDEHPKTGLALSPEQVNMLKGHVGQRVGCG